MNKGRDRDENQVTFSWCSVCSGSSCAAGEDLECVAKGAKRAILFCNYQHSGISEAQVLMNDGVSHKCWKQWAQ